jgi:hypothetical protein
MAAWRRYIYIYVDILLAMHELYLTTNNTYTHTHTYIHTHTSPCILQEGFGKDLAMHGDRLLVGAYEDSTKGEKAGAAHMFIMDSSKIGWRRVCSLVNNDTAAYDYFGWSVGLSDKFALIGAWQNDDAGQNAGAAYFFQKDSDYFLDGEESWSLHSKVYGWDHDDSFGISVAIASDNVAVIGAPGGTNSVGDYGSGYVSVFRFFGNVWSETDVLEASDASAGDYFGMTVALEASGGRVSVLVGAYGHAMYGNARTGMVYLMDATTMGQHVELQMIKAHDAAGADEFGRSVAILGDTIAIGATGDDDSGDSAGAVYIFEADGGSSRQYVQKEKIMPTEDCVYCYFGTRIAMTNDTLAVGLHGGSQVAGTVWLYQRDLAAKDTAFGLIYVLNSTDAIGGDQFGSSIYIDDTYLVVGAATSNGYDYDTGAAYVYSKQSHYVAVVEDGMVGMLTGSVVAAIAAASVAAVVYFFYFGSKPSGRHVRYAAYYLSIYLPIYLSLYIYLFVSVCVCLHICLFLFAQC